MALFSKERAWPGYFACCNSLQFEFLEEDSFEKIRRMKAILKDQFPNPAVFSDNQDLKFKKTMKKEGVNV